MLALEIEYLTGVAVAASAWDRGEAEWPPHPDRVFSALVCGWAERGGLVDEHAALEWLELLGPPEIQAADTGRRDVVDVFVPPNDMWVAGRVGSGLPKDPARALAVVPAMRRNRQPRQFPAVVPHETRVVLAWPGAEPQEVEAHVPALAGIASAVPSLGHSSSLVRMTVLTDPLPITPTLRPHPRGSVQLRVAPPGRLRELVEGYAAGRSSGWRPPRAPVVAYRRVEDEGAAPPPESVFGDEWIVLADAGGEAPALEAFPVAAKALRDALLAHADQPPHPCLTGHEADGSPARDPHLAILPLADVGWRYSAGRLMGVACVLPRGLEVARGADRRTVLQAIARFSVSDGSGGVLRMGGLGVWRLQREAEPERQSLMPSRYLGPARRWATVTPMVLDRHPKSRPDGGLASIVTAACGNVGLPAPKEIQVFTDAAVRGAPAALRAGPDPRGQGYVMPRGSPLATRPLRHLVLTFGEPVRGPVVLGAGRFVGMGLCLALPDDDAGAEG
jgi:CRISPR-associated protein Csb2